MIKSIIAVCILLVVCNETYGIINVQVTPRHVVDAAETVVAGVVAKDAGNWSFRVGDVIKGRAAGAFSLGLAKCNKDQVNDISKLLADNISQPAVLITSKRSPKGLLNSGGVWMEIVGKTDCQITGYAPELVGTFAGGSDMLARMLKHLAQHPNATVPTTVGVKWTDHCIAAKFEGAHALAAIEWPQNGKLALFVANPKGDHILAPKANDNAFDDVTSASGLSSKSVQFAFVDINGDGMADLVSYDGAAISVFLGGKSFKSAGANWMLQLDDCTGIAPCSLDGKPGILVSTGSSPIMLVAEQNGWKKIQLSRYEGNIGHVSPCIVADLDNDGYVDILQPGETGGILWKGSARGFLPPVKSPVCTGGGIARQAVADFNEDGFLDIFLAGSEKNVLWENDGKCGFTDVSRFAGSLSSKCPPGATAVIATDLNHDGRADLCIGYPSGEMLYHFNRGFRSMGEERELRLPGIEPQAGAGSAGLRAFASADFNGDSSADLAVLQADGAIHVYFNDRVDEPALMLRLPVGFVGPVTVSAWTDEMFPTITGTAIVTGHSPGTYMPVRDKGPVQLKCQFPGRPASVINVTVGAGVAEAALIPPASK